MHIGLHRALKLKLVQEGCESDRFRLVKEHKLVESQASTCILTASFEELNRLGNTFAKMEYVLDTIDHG